MENGSLIGALAIFTIGAALVLAVLAFGRFLRDPENRHHAKNTLVDDGPAATGHALDENSRKAEAKPLKARLDDSQASAHPDDPAAPGVRVDR